MSALPLTNAALNAASVRLGVLVAIGLGPHIDRASRLDGRLFHVVLAVSSLYAAVVFALAGAGRWRAWMWPVSATVDLTALAVLTYASGGAYSEIRLAFILVPAATALIGRPWHVLLGLLASFGAYAIACWTYVVVEDASLRHATVEIAGAGIRTALVGVLAIVLMQRTDRAAHLAVRSRRLVAALLSAEERERKRVAVSLHDAPLQNLYSALSALRRRATDAEGPDLAEGLLEGTIEQLRGVLTDLYPPALDHVGLGPAIETLARNKGRESALEIRVAVQGSSPTGWNRLLFSATRELLTNVAKHAHASEAEIRVFERGETLVLEVEDDGQGFDHSSLEEARRAGHIGLAAIADRLVAVGGSLDVLPTEAGTLVRLCLPLRRSSDRGHPDPRPNPNHRLHGRRFPMAKAEEEVAGNAPGHAG